MIRNFEILFFLLMSFQTGFALSDVYKNTQSEKSDISPSIPLLYRLNL